MTTRTQKLGRDLRVGDAIIFLGEVHVIAAIENTDLGRIARIGPQQIPLLFAWDAAVEVEEATPGRYDGYMSEVEGGWQVTSGGEELGTFADESIAATTLAGTSKRPRWKVAADGTITRLG